MERKIVELSEADLDLVCGGGATSLAAVAPTENDPPGQNIVVHVDVHALNQGTARMPTLIPL